MNNLYDPKTVAEATGCNEAEVAKVMPVILDALHQEGILNDKVAIGVLATVATECDFKPKEEAWYLRPQAREDYLAGKGYAKVDPVTKQRYYGRGFVQLTWKSNYAKYGKMLGIDLVNHPDLALQVPIAARILALYLKDHHADVACERQHWTMVRGLVNGGTKGLPRFMRCVQALTNINSPKNPRNHKAHSAPTHHTTERVSGRGQVLQHMPPDALIDYARQSMNQNRIGVSHPNTPNGLVLPPSLFRLDQESFC